MNKVGSIIAASTVGLALVGWAVWVFSGSGCDRPEEVKEVLRARARTLQEGKRDGKVRESVKVRPASRGKDGRLAASLAAAASNRVVSVTGDEETKLSKLEKEVLAELRAAMGAYDFNRLLRAIAKLGGTAGDLSSTSVYMRKTILQTLGRFGSKGLAEVVGFLADPDPDVAQMAELTLNQAATRIDMFASDIERAETVCTLSKVVTDPSTLDMMFSQIQRMRNSVSADTLSYIMENGTDAAKESVRDIVTFVTGDETIDTPEKVAEWKAANPDGEDDNRKYGGRKTLSEMTSPTDFYR